MKNMKAIILLVLAIITGLAAAVYAASWVSQRGNVASTKVVVAAVDIELGSKINPADAYDCRLAQRARCRPARSTTSRSCKAAW